MEATPGRCGGIASLCGEAFDLDVGIVAETGLGELDATFGIGAS